MTGSIDHCDTCERQVNRDWLGMHEKECDPDDFSEMGVVTFPVKGGPGTAEGFDEVNK